METESITTRVRKKWRWILVIVFLAANVFVWHTLLSKNTSGLLTVHFLDVGQGDAIFIDAPNGNQLLIDGGPPGKLIPALSKVMPFSDRTIDLLALTHPHLDHFAGLIDVFERYEVGGIVTSGTIHTTPDYASFKGAQKAEGVSEIVLHRGSQIDMGDGVVLDVLLPENDVSDASAHAGMLVMRLSYGSTSIMFTGDMENSLEQYLVKRDGAALESDVLKAGHHGSKTSSSELFLKQVRPTAAVISSGEGNTYKHPSPETLATFERFGVEVYRTDATGTITLTTDGKEMKIVE